MVAASASSSTSALGWPAANSAASLPMTSVVPERNTSTSTPGWARLNAATVCVASRSGCEVYRTSLPFASCAAIGFAAITAATSALTIKPLRDTTFILIPPKDSALRLERCERPILPRGALRFAVRMNPGNGGTNRCRLAGDLRQAADDAGARRLDFHHRLARFHLEQDVALLHAFTLGNLPGNDNAGVHVHVDFRQDYFDRAHCVLRWRSSPWAARTMSSSCGTDAFSRMGL